MSFAIEPLGLEIVTELIMTTTQNNYVDYALWIIPPLYKESNCHLGLTRWTFAPCGEASTGIHATHCLFSYDCVYVPSLSCSKYKSSGV